jgi:hypothetical protein
MMGFMGARSFPGLEPFAIAAAAIAGVMTGVYVGMMRSQDDTPLVWVVAILLGALLLALYGAVRTAPRRREALMVAGVSLWVLGVLALLSIGLPILAAGVMALVSSTRQAT